MVAGDFLTTAEASKRLRTTPRTILNLFARGLLTGIQPSKRLVLVERGSVERLLAEGFGRRRVS
jgi:excisionase family DNA binding protein